MELTKEQMKRVIEELESSYETKMLEDKSLEEIIQTTITVSRHYMVSDVVYAEV